MSQKILVSFSLLVICFYDEDLYLTVLLPYHAHSNLLFASSYFIAQYISGAVREDVYIVFLTDRSLF